MICGFSLLSLESVYALLFLQEHALLAGQLTRLLMLLMIVALALACLLLLRTNAAQAILDSSQAYASLEERFYTALESLNNGRILALVDIIDSFVPSLPLLALAAATALAMILVAFF